jgi:hypothetical protein
LNFLLILLLAYTYSPQDSSWNLVTLGSIPDRAILFAEIAARDGGRAGVDLAVLLEIAGRFPQAVRCYNLAANSASDPLLVEWLNTRISGTRTLDTLLILQAVISNDSDIPATDITVEIPLPESHPPYQRIDYLASSFAQDGNLLKHHIPTLPGKTQIILPLVLHITQNPYTFRPFSKTSPCMDIPFEDLTSLIRSLPVPATTDNQGPCLEVANMLRERSIEIGLDLQTVGGLVRIGTDSIMFHAWNLVSINGLPIDALLFLTDSLRGIGHCPTDLIPLWNYDYTDGHEVSIYYRNQDAKLSVSMEALFTSPESVMWILEIINRFSLLAVQ